MAKLLCKSSLPNTVGYQFIAVYNDGNEVKQIVKKDTRPDKHGTHYVDNFKDIKGWKRIPIYEQD